MTLPIASETRVTMRERIGYNLGALIVSEVSCTIDSASLWDIYGLAKGGNDEYNGRQVVIFDASCSTMDGEKSFVSDFDATEKDATMSPAFSAALTDGDKYEMWSPPYTYEQVNNHINQAIIAATDDILRDKVDSTTLLKLPNIYEYTVPTGFVALHTVEYEYGMGVSHLLDACEVAWTSGTGTTTTADATFEKVGTYCSKNVVASVSTNTILCYEDISSIDISACDKVEFWMYSSIALTAGQLQIHLDDTAAIASGVEKIDIPAMTAATWYRHSLSLANPHLDIAIISIGIFQVANVDDFTFYVDDVDAVLENSRIYRILDPDKWKVVQASTNLLQLTESGYARVGNNKRLRLSGYQIPAELSADATAATVDPDYIVAKATGTLLMAHAGGSQVDVDARQSRARDWLTIAEKRLLQGRTSLAMNTRFVS